MKAYEYFVCLNIVRSQSVLDKSAVLPNKYLPFTLCHVLRLKCRSGRSPHPLGCLTLLERLSLFKNSDKDGNNFYLEWGFALLNKYVAILEKRISLICQFLFPVMNINNSINKSIYTVELIFDAIHISEQYNQKHSA